MNIPTPKKFDYDLWTAESGKYMVRVRSTGEVCEVDLNTMRFLRAEENQMMRSIRKLAQAQSQNEKEPLSLDSLVPDCNDIPFPVQQENQVSLEERVEMNILIEHFLSDLTPNQLGVFQNCVIGGKNYTEYAADVGFTRQYIQKCIRAIRKKAENIWGSGCV